MIVSLAEVHARLEQKKKQRRELNAMRKDAVASHARYQEIVEEMAKLREEKKAIENELFAGDDAAELDALKEDIKTDVELLADIALSLYANSEPVEVIDQNDVRWVPLFAVRFRKDDGRQ